MRRLREVRRHLPWQFAQNKKRRRGLPKFEHMKARRETRWAGFGQNLDFPASDEKFNLFVNSVTRAGKTKIIYRELDCNDLH